MKNIEDWEKELQSLWSIVFIKDLLDEANEAPPWKGFKYSKLKDFIRQLLEQTRKEAKEEEKQRIIDILSNVKDIEGETYLIEYVDDLIDKDHADNA